MTMSLQVLRESVGEGRSSQRGTEKHRANAAALIRGFYSLIFKLEIRDLPVL